MAAPMTDDQYLNYHLILEEAGVILPSQLSADAERSLRIIANGGRWFCEGVQKLVAEARRAGYQEADDHFSVYMEGVAFYRDDDSLVVTVSIGELAERGMPDPDVIGVCWGPGDDLCLDHSLAHAGELAATDPDDRGMLLYTGWEMSCYQCKAAARAEATA